MCLGAEEFVELIGGETGFKLCLGSHSDLSWM